jgi:hypothetical protein
LKLFVSIILVSIIAVTLFSSSIFTVVLASKALHPIEREKYSQNLLGQNSQDAREGADNNNTLVSTCMSFGGNAEVESAVDPSNGYIYEEWIGCNGIGFSRSTNGGLTFSSAITILGSLDSSKDFSWDPAIAVNNSGVIYAAFMHSSGGTNSNGGRPMVAISYDHGASFTRVVNVSSSNSTEFSDRDFIAVSGNGTVYVTWDYAPNASRVSTTCPPGGSCYFNKGDFNIVISHSTDGGLNWSPAVPISPGYPNGGAVSGPLLIEPNGQIDVLYEDYMIGTNLTLGTGNNYFATSSDGGRTWTTGTIVGGGGGRYLSNTEWWIDGDISRDSSGTLYASFDTPNTTGTENAWLTYSNDDGKSWSNPIELNKGIGSATLNIEPGVAGANSSVYVAWMADNTSGWSTYFQVYSDQGTVLSPPMIVSGSIGLNGIWGGDTLGITSVKDGVSLSWGYAIASSKGGAQGSEIFSSTMYSVAVTSGGNGSTSPSQLGLYSIGSTITVHAFPDQGSSFQKWVTDSQYLSIQNPNSPTTSVKILGGGQITALFVPSKGSTPSQILTLQLYQIYFIVGGILIILASAFVVVARRVRRPMQ